MELWKILLITLGIVPGILALVFGIYACIRVGALSDSIDYLADIDEEDNSNERGE